MNKVLTRWYWDRHARHNGLRVVRAEVEGFQAAPPQEKRRIQGRRLQDLVRFAAALDGAYPEWQALAREEDPEAVLDSWRHLPIMTKQDQRERFPLAGVQARLNGKGILNSTGGSTGEPAFFVHDAGMVATGLALQTHHWQEMGWRPGVPLLILWGAQRDIGAGLTGLPAIKKQLSDYLYGFHVVAGFAITAKEALGALDWLEANGPAAVYGFTNLLDFFARTALEHGRRPAKGLVTTAWNGGECLFPDQSARFESVFGVPILNYYAGRELGTLGCQARSGGPLIVPRPYIHLELVDQAGEPLAPGMDGRIVVTSMPARGTPFLRYEVGDLGCYAPAHADAAGLGALESVSGRISSLLEIGGRSISNLFWNHLFKDFQEIQQFQVVSRKERGLLLRFRGSGFEPGREMKLRTILQEFLGPVLVECQWVERIPLTVAGKLIQVVEE